MSDKIALVSCSGLSPLGLVVRAASVELALENENIVAACITEYSAQPNNCSPILDDAKIVTITGCSDDCASVILKEKEIDSVKNIASLSGFSNPMYFSSVFKQTVGVSPSEYNSKQSG